MNDRGDVILQTKTQGLNPAVVPEVELRIRIESNTELQAQFKKVKIVHFYGAGCGTETPAKILQDLLSDLFSNAIVSVYEDTVAAVHAVTSKAGIVCILGTGSNSCYFDGKEIHASAPALGYSIMDEASGNYFGKQLLRDYFYKKMPSTLARNFEKQFEVVADTIKINLYKKPNPNMYLASFAEFIFTNDDVNDYFYSLIKEGVLKFIDYRILCFEAAKNVPIHFIGSIAHFSESIISECFNTHGLKMGKVIQRPIDGLISYYRLTKFNS